MEWLIEHLNEAEWWVGAALVVFTLLMLMLKVPGMAAKGLDARAEKIRAELNEAERLRLEAETLLASIRTKREDAERQAAEMIENAQVEASRMETVAKAKAEEQIKRRVELAERRIKTAEAQAISEVKAAAVDLAAEVAASVLSDRLSAGGTDPLVDTAVKQLPGKLN